MPAETLENRPMTELPPAGIKAAVKAAHEMRAPLMLWGPPGVGKSQIVAQAAHDLGVTLNDVRLSTMDAVDLRGLPVPAGDVTRWLAPNWLPTGGDGVLFLDELPAAPMDVQVAAFQLILDRRLGDYQLPDGWTCIGAGNRASDRAGAKRISTALSNRFLHLDFVVSATQWSRWALGAGLPFELAAFIGWKPSYLHDFTPGQDDREFATPRTWEMVGRVQAQGLSDKLTLALMSGAVGQDKAVEYVNFLRIFSKLPNPDVVLASPNADQIPDDPSAQYALSSAIAQKATVNNIDRVCRYSDLLPADLKVFTLMSAVQHNSALQSCAAVARHFAENATLYGFED